MACFREHGYAATSIRDLERATGLKAASLYNAFGNKAGLFNAVLDRYRTDVVDRRTSEHLRPELGTAGIRSFFMSTYTTEPLPAHGCLLTNSAIEFSSIESGARRQVKRGLTSIRQAFASLLRAAQVGGEIAESVDIDATADALLVLYEGMLAMLRTGRAMNVDFDRVIEAILAQLRSSDLAPGES